ncbi:TylF/MycF/NovP-related O-methyltransferase [Kordiimonas sp.]|uniref:TylF/MycF/NovP-related O-methyltransferase n=1 Tax=Kordiimonas sp. TaxID=1970157 RepID=UPI003B528B3E
MKPTARKIRYSTKQSALLVDHPIPDIDNDPLFSQIFNAARPYSMTAKSAMFALYSAMNYVLDQNISGDFVECGVWRGGSSLLAGLILKKRGVTNRSLYLYDTFQGMTEPTKHDVDKNGTSAHSMMEKFSDENGWCYASVEDVTQTFRQQNFQFPVNLIKGDVLKTIPKKQPKNISILRLDTDWYESTKCELENLYPKLSKGGVLIIDDYGHWAGARKAVDEYFLEVNAPLLIRINEDVRLAIKLN